MQQELTFVASPTRTPMEPGTVVRSRWPVTDDAIFDERIRLTVIQGRRSGPTVWLQGGIHGDEFAGCRAVAELAHELDPEAISGRLVLVPMVDPQAVRARQRFSPVDGQDLFLSFPGDPEGSWTDRLAHAITTEVRDTVDAFIDVHAGTSAYECIPFAIYRDGLAGSARARSLAISTRGQAVVRERASASKPRKLYSVLTDMGVPSILMSAGGHRSIEPPLVDTLKSMCLRVMQHMEMLPSSADVPRSVVRDEMYFLGTRTGGFIRNAVRRGDEVRKGDLLATLFDDDGIECERIVSVVDHGLIIQTAAGLLHPGELAVEMCGPPQDDDQ